MHTVETPAATQPQHHSQTPVSLPSAAPSPATSHQQQQDGKPALSYAEEWKHVDQVIKQVKQACYYVRGCPHNSPHLPSSLFHYNSCKVIAQCLLDLSVIAAVVVVVSPCGFDHIVMSWQHWICVVKYSGSNLMIHCNGHILPLNILTFWVPCLMLLCINPQPF